MTTVEIPKEPLPELTYPGMIVAAYVLFVVGGYLLLSQHGDPIDLLSVWVPDHLGESLGLILWPRFYAISIRQSVNVLRGQPIASLWDAVNRWLGGNAHYFFAGALYLGFTILTTWLIVGLLRQSLIT